MSSIDDAERQVPKPKDHGRKQPGGSIVLNERKASALAPVRQKRDQARSEDPTRHR